ncbi:uncharacterized protein [Heptranchias perlo]|uniref:uncharacterized protein n=1 Tax=Heptranchias perlo TaxID=212740 RepID=UPI00355A196E
MDVHHQMLGTLESLPESLRTMRRGMKESSSNLAQGFTQSLKPILYNMERVVTSISTPVEPTMMQRLMADVAASIAAQTDVIKDLQAMVAAQTAAVEAQTAAIVALGTTGERGFEGVPALQQSVLQLITRIAEAPPRESGSGAMAVGPAVLSQDNSIPALNSATPPVPLLLPISQPGQAAAAHAEVVQSEAGPSQPRAARGRPPRLSACSSIQGWQPSTTPAPATGDASHRSNRMGKGTRITGTKGMPKSE